LSRKKAINILALIPARGGSKNPPDKNILNFRNKPLIVHSIEHAKQSNHVNRIIVSTDSQKIANISLHSGAEVPFLRPVELAQDNSTDLEVFKHTLGWLENNEKYIPDIVVHLRPTSPIRPPCLIDRGIELLINDSKADSLRTVILAPHTPYKMWLLNEGYLKPLLTHDTFDEPYNMPRQELPYIYWQNAYLDIIRTSTIIEKDSMTGDVILPLIMDSEDDVDIDSLQDLLRAKSKIINV